MPILGTRANPSKPPVITSSPVTNAQARKLIPMRLQATDPEGQSLAYFLDQAPTGNDHPCGIGSHCLDRRMARRDLTT